VITRRASGTDRPFIPVIRLGEIEIDILNRVVRAGDSVVHLSGIEQSLLYLLASRSGRVVSREEILDAIWGTDFVAESNIVDRHVRSLRIKLQNGLPPPALHRHGPRAGLTASSRRSPTPAGTAGRARRAFPHELRACRAAGTRTSIAQAATSPGSGFGPHDGMS